MSKFDNIDNKKGLFTMIMEDTTNVLLILARAFLALIVVSFCLVIPATLLILKALSTIFIAISGTAGDIIGVVLIFTLIFLLCFFSRNSTHKIAEWIMTGHFQLEVSEENNRRMRNLWLKTHKGILRTKNIKWKLSLNNKNNFYIFQTIYPVDKYGNSEVTKAPVLFRTLVPITQKFFGNLPIEGDTIQFSWTTTSNNNIKNLHVKAVEYTEKNESDYDSKDLWIDLDENAENGTLCASNITTGNKVKIEGILKLNKSVSERIQLCFWYMPDEAEGESVFREKF